jgi:AI-2 transport protein TqsA
MMVGFFVALNLMLSSVLEPLMLGKRLNMTLTVQLLAFLFWQALLGMTGAILAIPLTFLLKKVWLALRQPV